jgi:hypothetical protein
MTTDITPKAAISDASCKKKYSFFRFLFLCIESLKKNRHLSDSVWILNII